MMYELDIVDGKTYPADRGPRARFFSTQYPRLCQACFEMLSIASFPAYRSILLHGDPDLFV